MEENRLDDAIFAFVREQSESARLALHMIFLDEDLYVPIAAEVAELQPGEYGVPVICIKTEAGAGALPAFTSVRHLLQWKPQGCLYTSTCGGSLIRMAVGMADVDEILVNPSAVPRGRIPRRDFQRMLALKQSPPGR